MIRINWFELKKDMIMGFVLVMALSMVLSMWTFVLGFHNFDTGHNIANLNEAYNMTFVDAGTDLISGGVKIRDATYIINMGSRQLHTGAVSLLVTGMMFGIGVTMLRYMKEEG